MNPNPFASRPWWLYLAFAGVAALIIWLLVHALTGKPVAHPKHTERQQRKLEATAAADTVKAARLDTLAQRQHTTGQQLARMARAYHRQTLPAHATLPIAPSPAATDSLRQFLTGYGLPPR